MQKRTPRWEAAASRPRSGPGGKQHAALTGAVVSLCGAGVGARRPGAQTFDPLHPAACRKCIATVARLARASPAPRTTAGRAAGSTAA